MNLPENSAVADQDGGQRHAVEDEEAEEIVGSLVPRRWKGSEGHALEETREGRMLHHSEDESLRGDEKVHFISSRHRLLRLR